MRRRVVLRLALLTAFAGTGLHTARAADQPRLPDAVRRTFEAKFPGAVVEKIDAEEEGGVTVYDIEFRHGDASKETDIAADGTMLEITVVISAKEIPPPRGSRSSKRRRARTGRVERIEITHETKGGKVLKLPKPLTHYAVEMKKNGRDAEIVVDADGTVVEAPKFTGGK